MSPSSRYANLAAAKIDVNHDEPREAVDYFTWRTTVIPDGLATVGVLEQLLAAMREDYVPPDATLQISGPLIYAHWRRLRRVEAAAREAVRDEAFCEDEPPTVTALRATLAPAPEDSGRNEGHTSQSPVADMHSAWGIIANVNNGDWTLQSSEWQEAARAWRDLVFHQHYCDLPAPAEGGELRGIGTNEQGDPVSGSEL